MPLAQTVRLRVYHDDCDPFGHVNQAAYLRLFERARWESLALGPGIDVFTRAGTWPAIRRAAVEYYSPAFPGDLLDFEMALTHMGRSSFSVHQVVRRNADRVLVASADFVAVCVDPGGRPTDVPPAIRDALGMRSGQPGPPVRHIAGPGFQLAVEEFGDGPAIVFIHAFPLDRTMWRPLAQRLAGWRRIAPDVPGFGLSDQLPGPPSMSRYADALAGLLDEMRIERAVVAGLSMGGYIAFELWRRHRSRVRGMILMHTRPEPDTPEARVARDATVRAVEDHGLRALERVMVPRLLAPGTLKSSAAAGLVRTMILDNQAAGVMDALRAMRDRSDSTGLLGNIDVPVLVVAGSEDGVIPADVSRTLAGAMPGARFEVMQGAGHLSPLELPEQVVSVVQDFLDTFR